MASFHTMTSRSHVLPRRTRWLLAGFVGLTLAASAQASSPLFDSAKPCVNLVTIGHVDHGKTTLTAAITKVLDHDGFPTTALSARTTRVSGPIPGRSTAAQRRRGVTISTAHVEYESAARCYKLVDTRSSDDYIKNMITGATLMDGAILVVSAADGPTPQTREHILLARQVGVPAIVAFLNRTDLVDRETADRVENELREILDDNGYFDTPIVRGNASKALDGDPDYQEHVRKVVRAFDETIPLPTADIDRPFLMTVEDVFTISGRGTVVTGRVERGIVRAGDKLEIVGLTGTPTTTAADVEFFRKLLDRGQVGDDVGVLLPGIQRDDVERGQVLAKPGTIAPHTSFKAAIYFLTEDESGIAAPSYNGQMPQFYFGGLDVFGEFRPDEGAEPIMPGDNVEFSVELITSVALEPGSRFAVREGNVTVGVGVVVGIPDGW